MEGRQKKGKQQQQQQQQQQKPGQREKPQTGVRISCGKYAQHTAFPDWPWSYTLFTFPSLIGWRYKPYLTVAGPNRLWGLLRNKNKGYKKRNLKWGGATPKGWATLRSWECVVCAVFVCLVTQLCSTLCDPRLYSLPGSSVLGDSPGKNAGVHCHVLFQGIFPTQGLSPGLPHCRQILNHLSHQGSPLFTACVINTTCLSCNKSVLILCYHETRIEEKTDLTKQKSSTPNWQDCRINWSLLPTFLGFENVFSPLNNMDRTAFVLE